MNGDFLKGYRTLIFNGLSLALVILTGMTETIENPETLRYFTMGILIVNLVLRWFTSTPVPAKETV